MKTNIEIIKKQDLDLTIVIVTGILSKEKMLASLADYYSDQPTKSILCDLTKATWCNMESGHVHSAVSKGQEHATARTGCKTAVVVGSEHDFNITQMFASSASGEKYGPEIMAFKNVVEASSWLDIPQL